MRQSPHAAAVEDLASLCVGFFGLSDWLTNCEALTPDQLPLEIRRLLVHNEHMTATLKRHYNCPVGLRVLDHRADGDVYRRKILLTVDEGRRIVEFGIVRMSLGSLDEAARREILSRQTPLGEVFVRFEVLTKVEPRWFLRFPENTPVVQYFGPSVSEAFGRIGVIHCNGDPTIELLEVVAG
jgi:hypothetical protein